MGFHSGEGQNLQSICPCPSGFPVDMGVPRYIKDVADCGFEVEDTTHDHVGRW